MPKFEKGQSGNPGGRPKEISEVRELARERTPDAIAILSDIMLDKDCPPAARVSAARELLDRGYGRSPQAVALESSVNLGLASLLEAAMERRPVN